MIVSATILVTLANMSSLPPAPTCGPEIEIITETSVVREQLDLYWVETGRLGVGLAEWTPERCTIYALQVWGEEYNKEILDHEKLHCMSGQFHK
jgi:hypothetical protein